MANDSQWLDARETPPEDWEVYLVWHTKDKQAYFARAEIGNGRKWQFHKATDRPRFQEMPHYMLPPEGPEKGRDAE